MRILYLLKENFSTFPPCVAHVSLMVQAGAKVTVVAGGCPESVSRNFRELGVELIVLSNSLRADTALQKLKGYVSFREQVAGFVRASRQTFDGVWFGNVTTGFALTGMFQNTPRGITVLELYDKTPHYRQALRSLLPRLQAVIACQTTRAEIMQVWFGLKSIPVVIPNKTHQHPRRRSLEGTAANTSQAIARIRGTNSILYQGLIMGERTLVPLARALATMPEPKWTLFLMGPSFGNTLDTVKSAYRHTEYLGEFDSPIHLEVTSHARIGVAYYDRSSLNTLFCAPNKTYEYAGFGIPVLANDVPGLRDTVAASGAGVSVDFSSPKRILEAIAEIDNDYTGFSDRATDFFEATDNRAAMEQALNRLTGSN